MLTIWKKKTSPFSVTDTIVLFCVFIFMLSVSVEVSLCMPWNNGRVDPGMIEVYRPLIARLPAESPWNYLFQQFEELDGVIRTSRRGQLLGAEDIYELIQQLYPRQLGSLLNSVLPHFGPTAPAEILEQCAVMSRQLLLGSNGLLLTLEEVAHGISIIRGADISNQLLDESFPALVRGLNLSPEVERFYATRILLRTEYLYLQYGRLFTLLHFVGR